MTRYRVLIGLVSMSVLTVALWAASPAAQSDPKPPKPCPTFVKFGCPTPIPTPPKPKK